VSLRIEGSQDAGEVAPVEVPGRYLGERQSAQLPEASIQEAPLGLDFRIPVNRSSIASG
jgi:hypothetical protein